MWHKELGKSTADIWAEEYISNPEQNLYRSRLKQQIANVLQRRAEQLAALEESELAKSDMIEEGGPLSIREQGEQDD